MKTKKPARTLVRWLKKMGACNPERYKGLSLQAAWIKAGRSKDRPWVVEQALKLPHNFGSGIENCWCSDKGAARYKDEVFAAFRAWRRQSAR